MRGERARGNGGQKPSSSVRRFVLAVICAVGGAVYFYALAIYRMDLTSWDFVLFRFILAISSLLFFLFLFCIFLPRRVLLGQERSNSLRQVGVR